MYEKITSENVIMFAIKHYNNPQCEGELEFHDDLKRFKYIKRLFKKYVDTKVLKERLLLNHFIVLKNVFGTDASITLLLYKIEREDPAKIHNKLIRHCLSKDIILLIL